jgi:hypothetical protein
MGGEMGGACSAHGKVKNAYKIFVGKPEGKIPFGGPWHRWADSTKIDLEGKG